MMTNIAKFAVVALVGMLLVGGFSRGTQSKSTAPVPKAFIGARVIDGTGRAPIKNGVIVVRDGRIEAVGPSSTVAVPASAERINASGKTIIPGIINTHGHVGATR